MNQYAVVRQANIFEFTKFHESLEEARTEAERLARKEKARFFVLKMVGYVDRKEVPVEWVEV